MKAKHPWLLSMGRHAASAAWVGGIIVHCIPTAGKGVPVCVLPPQPCPLQARPASLTVTAGRLASKQSPGLEAVLAHTAPHLAAAGNSEHPGLARQPGLRDVAQASSIRCALSLKHATLLHPSGPSPGTAEEQVCCLVTAWWGHVPLMSQESLGLYLVFGVHSLRI